MNLANAFQGSRPPVRQPAQTPTSKPQSVQKTGEVENLMTLKQACVKDGILTLYDAPFQETCTRSDAGNTSLDYNSDGQGPPDFKFELFPLHSQLLGESLLVSFPPLIDMLKFSG